MEIQANENKYIKLILYEIFGHDTEKFQSLFQTHQNFFEKIQRNFQKNIFKIFLSIFFFKERMIELKPILKLLFNFIPQYIILRSNILSLHNICRIITVNPPAPEKVCFCGISYQNLLKNV